MGRGAEDTRPMSEIIAAKKRAPAAMRRPASLQSGAAHMRVAVRDARTWMGAMR
jgi:hypothetical protein